jgi:hypothetical protein
MLNPANLDRVVYSLAQERSQLRRLHHWDLADLIRKRIECLGYSIEDVLPESGSDDFRLLRRWSWWMPVMEMKLGLDVLR